MSSKPLLPTLSGKGGSPVHKLINHNGGSAMAALYSFIKSLFGAGILSIPHAFRQVGAPLGAVAYAVMGIGVVATMFQLIAAKNLCRQHGVRLPASSSSSSSSSDGSGSDSDTGPPLPPTATTVPAPSSSTPPSTASTPFAPPPSISTPLSPGQPPPASVNQLQDVVSLPPAASTTNGSVNADDSDDDDDADADGRDIVTYADVGQVACGHWGKLAVEAQVVILEVLFCAGFVIVILDNAGDVFPQINRYASAAIAAAILMPLNCIKLLKDMWAISLLGLLVYVVGVVGFSFYHGAIEPVKDHVKDPSATHGIADFVSYFSVAVYSLEGINLVLPIETSIRDSSKSFAVIGSGMAFYTAIVAAFGAYAYTEGLGTCPVITDCFSASASTTTIRVSLMLSLLVTHPLTLFPASEILERQLFKPHAAGLFVKSVLLRSSLVAISVGVALSIPKFSLFAGLVGSLFMLLVGFALPPVFYLRIHSKLDIPVSWWVRVGSFVSITFGVVMTVLGTIQAVKNIVKDA